LRSPGSDPSNPINWRMSVAGGGTPGGSDSVAFAGNALVDGDHDGLVELLEYVMGTSDSVPNAPGTVPYAAVEARVVGGVTSNYLTFTARLATGADSATCQAELATALSSWNGTEAAVVYLGEVPGGAGNVIRKWRAAQPISSAGEKQFFRLRVQMH
jgi:hypothetical protein